MAADDKVQIELQITGADKAATDVAKVNAALRNTAAAQTTAAAATKAGADASKEMAAAAQQGREGLESLARAASFVSPEAGAVVGAINGIKIAAKGLGGVLADAKAGVMAVFAQFANPAGLALAGLGAILALVQRISAEFANWEQRQREVGQAAVDAAEKLAQSRAARMAAGQSEARSIITEAGALGIAPTAENVTQIQSMAAALQKAVPMASPDSARKAATTAVLTGVPLETAAAGLAAQSFGAGVTPQPGFGSPADAARLGLVASAANLTPAQGRAVALARAIAPATPGADLVGAFNPEGPQELARVRAENIERFRRLNEQIPDENGVGFFDWLTGTPETLSRRYEANEITGFQAQKAARIVIQNSVVNNRPGQPTGVLGPPSEQSVPIP